MLGRQLAAAALLAMGIRAQTDSTRALLNVRVVVSGTDVPLANSVVEVAASNVSRLTDSRGVATLADLLPGTYRVAARHIGYTPRQVTVTVAAGRQDQRIELAHVAVQVAGLTAYAHQPCTQPGLP